jgi:hypothetical protein
MIVLRPEQMNAFADASQLARARRLQSALAHPFPLAEAHFGAPALEHSVRLGIERAQAHGIDADADIQCYLRLMLLFGSHWERDPQVAWAAAAMSAAEGTPSQRIARLWEQAQAWRIRVRGPNDSLYVDALRSIDGKSVEDLCKSSSRSQRDLMIQLAALYPRKFTEAGEQALYDLTRLAVEACRPFELLDRWAVVLIAQAMFLFGGGVLDDPLHPWAGDALKAAEGAAVDQKLERLLMAMKQAAARRVASS